MVRSADCGGRTRIAGVAAAGLAAVSLSGCVSTQTKAGWLRINSARVRASQVRTRVTHPGALVHVQSVALVTAAHRTRFVVTVRNRGVRAVSDLPISVGYRTAGGKRVYLNAGATSGYFDAHLATVAQHESLSWVSAVTRALPKGAHPFALVGSRPSVSADDDGSLPVISTAARDQTATSLRVSIHNSSSIPQYQLPVYATVDRHGHAIAAAQASVTELSGGATQVVRLHLVGSAHRATARIQAPPTILQ